MLRRTALTVAASIVGVGLVASPADAGGLTWLDFDSRYEVVGEVAVSNRTDVWFPTAEDAQAALAGTHYVYLIPGYRYRYRWRSPGEGAVLAGRVTLSRLRWAGNILRARSEFVVPDLPSGRYSAYACDLGCNVPLGDVQPTPLRIFETEMEARLVDRLSDARAGLRTKIRLLDARFEDRLADSRSSIMSQVGARDSWTEEKLRKEIVALNTRIDDLNKAQEPTWSDYSLRIALGLLGLIGAILFWTRRRAKPVHLQPIEDGIESGQEPVVRIFAGKAR